MKKLIIAAVLLVFGVLTIMSFKSQIESDKPVEYAYVYKTLDAKGWLVIAYETGETEVIELEKAGIGSVKNHPENAAKMAMAFNNLSKKGYKLVSGSDHVFVFEK